MYIFIVNPVAGNGRAKRIFHQIKQSTLFQQIESSIYFTQYDGHAEEMTKELVLGHHLIEAFIVIGGDGTLHEVVNGLSDMRVPIAFIRGGSGNDFARGIHQNEKPLKLFESIIIQGEKSPYWVGKYTVDKRVKRCFVNSMGFGFDAEVTKYANESKLKRALNFFHLGKLSYVFALIKTLFVFQFFNVEVIVDGQKKVFKKCLMVTIANHPYYGGGMKIIPHAKLNQQTVSVLVIHSISKLKILALFLTVFWGGHMRFPEVETMRASNVVIRVEKERLYQVDGETNVFQTCTISKEHRAVSICGPKKENFQQKTEVNHA
ncbi:diacylglycerol kinase family lipid kinase [Virgibacillus soli]|uniref:Diacylglycerol kinase family lipid kinase n=1 Tax=Paracerasibacillus soli TaxID=480284 RepID=A0ABU5CQU0_9BACI|nr:diacylglycerol kinase family lipid kinase [Virgibacillus soli]MDY0408733.1 diacylglycerol kinase family lipid kinase [Virgibacillus soli]